VCVCVSGGLPLDPYKPSPQNFAWAPHFTRAQHRARGRSQMSAPRGTPIVTPSDIPCRIKNCLGASKQKLRLGWVCIVKFYLQGAHPAPGPPGSTLLNGGVCFENWAGASKQKLLLRVDLCIKILFVGGSPQPKAHWVFRSICTGLFHYFMKL
jgi:hypothetical protein